MSQKIFGIIPTNFCNFNCKHCGVNKSKKMDYIPIKKVEKLLDVAKNQGFERMFITGGGEPTIDFKKVIGIIKEAEKRKIESSMVTNGSFLLKDIKKLDKLKEAGLKVISFSIDKFHMEYISYPFLLKVLKKSIKLDLEITIKISYVYGNKKYVQLLLEKIRKDLDARKLIFNKKWGAMGLLIMDNAKIKIQVVQALKNPYTKEDYKTRKINPKRIKISKCPISLPVANQKGQMLPCCSFESMNNPDIYSTGKIENLEGILDIEKNIPLLGKIIHKKYPFIGIWLKVRKDKKLRKIFDRDYQSPCEFCYLAMKHRDEIEKMPEPKFFEKLFFCIKNFHWLAERQFIYIKSKITEKILDMYA